MHLMAATDTSWLQKFQEFVHYSLGPIEPTPDVKVYSVVALAAGLTLAFRSAKLLRPMVTVVGVLLGMWLGIALADFLKTPAPITAAIGAVILAATAFKTYRVWLVMGSVVTLFFIATTYQLGKGDLSRYIPAEAKKYIEQHSLPSKAEQQGNLHPERWKSLEAVGQRMGEELRNFGLQGWILPAIAAVIGAVLAWKALNVFAIVWVGLIGAISAVLGGTTFICTYWPDARSPIAAKPHVVGGVMIGLWLLGLIYQAKEARLPKPKPIPPKPDAAKS